MTKPSEAPKAEDAPPRRPISAELVARAAQMRAAGASLRSCAQRFDVAESALGKRLRRLQSRSSSGANTRRSADGRQRRRRSRRRVKTARVALVTTAHHSDADDGDDEDEDDDGDDYEEEEDTERHDEPRRQWRVALAPPPLPLEPRPWWSPFELVMRGGGWAFPTASSLTATNSVADVVVTAKQEALASSSSTAPTPPDAPSVPTAAKTWLPTDLVGSESGAWGVASQSPAPDSAPPEPEPEHEALEVETDSATLSSLSLPPQSFTSAPPSPYTSRRSSPRSPSSVVPSPVARFDAAPPPSALATKPRRPISPPLEPSPATATAQARTSWDPTALLKFQLRRASPRRLEKLRIGPLDALPSQSERRWSF